MNKAPAHRSRLWAIRIGKLGLVLFPNRVVSGFDVLACLTCFDLDGSFVDECPGASCC